LYEARGFYSTSTATNAGNIIAAEYFIDNDPGIGNGTNVSIGTTGDSVNFIASIPTTGLSEGFHILSLRVKDADSNWSEYEQRGFYVTATSGVSAGYIVATEYFIDTDPGI